MLVGRSNAFWNAGLWVLGWCSLGSPVAVDAQCITGHKRAFWAQSAAYSALIATEASHGTSDRQGQHILHQVPEGVPTAAYRAPGRDYMYLIVYIYTFLGPFKLKSPARTVAIALYLGKSQPAETGEFSTGADTVHVPLTQPRPNSIGSIYIHHSVARLSVSRFVMMNPKRGNNSTKRNSTFATTRRAVSRCSRRARYRREQT